LTEDWGWPGLGDFVIKGLLLEKGQLTAKGNIFDFQSGAGE
jgi:hypothetical protein